MGSGRETAWGYPLPPKPPDPHEHHGGSEQLNSRCSCPSWHGPCLPQGKI